MTFYGYHQKEDVTSAVLSDLPVVMSVFRSVTLISYIVKSSASSPVPDRAKMAPICARRNAVILVRLGAWLMCFWKTELLIAGT